MKYAHLQPNESLLCLECRDGIIPIEAKLQGVTKILGQDRFPNCIRNAIINSKLAKMDIDFIATSITQVKDSFDVGITQCIFSKEKGNPFRIINEIMTTAKNVIQKKLIILTNHPEDIETYRPDCFKEVEKKDIIHKQMPLTVLVYEKV